jgi:hypothetical protein
LHIIKEAYDVRQIKKWKTGRRRRERKRGGRECSSMFNPSIFIGFARSQLIFEKFYSEKFSADWIGFLFETGSNCLLGPGERNWRYLVWEIEGITATISVVIFVHRYIYYLFVKIKRGLFLLNVERGRGEGGEGRGRGKGDYYSANNYCFPGLLTLLFPRWFF